ncbi:kinase-like domain-containing protein [Melanogaster broomeanus]|nr:kinase-like domain-containing protein [Melanogaster broomeanus]
MFSTAAALLFGLGTRIALDKFSGNAPNDPNAPDAIGDIILLGVVRGVALYFTLMEFSDFTFVVAFAIAARLAIEFTMIQDLIEDGYLYDVVGGKGGGDANSYYEGSHIPAKRRKRLVKFQSTTEYSAVPANKPIRPRKQDPARKWRMDDSVPSSIVSSTEALVDPRRVMGPVEREIAILRAQVGVNTEALKAHRKKLRRELKVWAKLQHRNVVPLLGVVSGFGLLPGMVSPWFNNGSLSSYLARQEAAMNLADRQRLLCDIAAGLGYLHSQGIVHGDMHSENVLVDEEGRACLTDFGLSLIIQDFVGKSYLKSSVCGVVRFADPELVRQVHVEGKMAHPTTPSDIYSFGGLMLHVLTGKKPYDGLGDLLILTTVVSGQRPQLPIDHPLISSTHELLIQRCWSREEKMRPSVEEIQVIAPVDI